MFDLSAGDMAACRCADSGCKGSICQPGKPDRRERPIEKIPMVNETRDAITDYTNIAFMGSNVISGSASAVVVTVGDHTLFGSMASEVAHEQWKQASAKESTRYRGC